MQNPQTASIVLMKQALGKGQNGVATNGVAANFMSFDRGTFWVFPFTYFYIPKSARTYLFPRSVKIHYVCGGPISVDPICPQPRYTADLSTMILPATIFQGRVSRASAAFVDPICPQPKAADFMTYFTNYTFNKPIEFKTNP